MPSASTTTGSPRWQWQRGGWLLVDRLTGRISQLNLPEFDPLYSRAAWHRDYVAYCGVSEAGKKLYAVVTQVGRWQPILKKDLGEPAGGDDPDSECGSSVGAHSHASHLSNITSNITMSEVSWSFPYEAAWWMS